MTTEQAELEILRLQEVIARNKRLEVPKPLENPDFTSLIEIAKNHIEAISNNGFSDEDSDHWFYEAVMECVYGKSVWKWINNKTE